VRVPPGVVILALPEIPRSAEREQSEGPRQEGVLKSAAKGIIEARILHLEHSEEVLSFARVATTQLQERLQWVTTVLYPPASDRGGCLLAMLFWVFSALAVVSALAIVGGVYLLARR
jgi:hypothetical protein